MSLGSLANTSRNWSASSACVVGPTGCRGDGLQRGFVADEEVAPATVSAAESRTATLPAFEGAGAELIGGAHHRRRIVGAEADRVHAYPPSGGLLGRVDGRDAAGVGSVGQQHHDVGNVALRRYRCRSRVGGRAVVTVAPVTLVGLGLRRRRRPARRSDRQRRWRRWPATSPRRSPFHETSSDSSMARVSRPLSVVGGTTSWAKLAERDDPDPRAGNLVLDELPWPRSARR